MPVPDDFYRILQVHYLAEPEVIESAYRRLAKKYHPDVNRSAGAELRMKKLNEAYETLQDVERRREYDVQLSFRRESMRSEPTRPQPTRSEPVRPEPTRPKTWTGTAQNPGPDPGIQCPPAARETLSRYFACLKSRDFEPAYSLITALDKKNIPRDDFIRWQAGVARVYVMQEVVIETEKLECNCSLNGTVFPQVAVFAVNTVEQNTVMGRIEKDTVIKKVVLEDKAWRVYVGFDDISPYIARFEELSGLLEARSAISDMVEHYSTKDSGTGLYNKKGFSEAAQREVWRYNRYGNVFSVMLLEIDPGKDARQARNQELARSAAAWAGNLLTDTFRKLDILGRWGEMGFIVLLPETSLNGCFRAAKKIKRTVETTPFLYSQKQHHLRLSIGIEEFNGSLEDTIRNLSDYISAAGKSRKNCIVYRGGLYE